MIMNYLKNAMFMVKIYSTYRIGNKWWQNVSTFHLESILVPMHFVIIKSIFNTSITTVLLMARYIRHLLYVYSRLTSLFSGFCI